MLTEYIKNYLKVDKSRSNKSNLIKLLISDNEKFSEINNFISFGTFKQKLYHFIEDKKSIPNCIICGSYVNWNEKDFKYRETCSNKCSGKLLKRISNKTKKSHPKFESKEQIYKYFTSGNLKITPSSIGKFYPEILKSAESILFVDKFNQKVYCFLKNIDSHPTCEHCGSKVKFNTFSLGYHIFCSVYCSSNSKSKKESISKTVKSKWGVDNISSVTREQALNTMVKKYGSHFSKTELFKQKFSNSCLNKFGQTHPLKNEYILNKVNSTIIDRYGVDNVMKLHNFVHKAIQTKKEKGIIFKWSSEDLKFYEKYRQKVTYLSEKNYLENIDIINPNGFKRGHLLHHLDHIYPVILGFINRIDAELISHPKNLQILPHMDNRIKSDKTEMTLEDFYNLIMK